MSDRRFNSYSEFLTKQFGGRVQKISIDAGFTCPNRDGFISTGGCTFCSNDAFNPSYCRPEKTVTQQIAEGIEFHKRRYRRAQNYLAYFQPYTNTYKPVDELERIYNEALACRNVVGIVIGTRPDMVSDDVLLMLADIQKHHYVMLEYGIESVYDATLRSVNRGHDFATAQLMVEKTADCGIPCGAHFILGLPGETKQMMVDSAAVISRLPLTTVKFHQLQIFRNTPMARQFVDRPSDFHLFTLDEYIDFIVGFTRRLRPTLVVERFAGEVPPRFLLSEPWLKLRYDEVLRLIEQRMEQLDVRQGDLWNEQ